MKNTVGIISFLLILGLVIGIVALAADEAGVDVKVTVQNFVVSVLDGNVTYGTLAVNTSRSTIAGEENEMQTATNEGSTAKISIKGSVSSPAGWTLHATTPNTNVYVHKFCNDTDLDCTTPPTNYTGMTSTGYTTLKASVANAGTVDFQLQITTPTSVSDYTEQDVDITVQAAAP